MTGHDLPPREDSHGHGVSHRHAVTRDDGELPTHSVVETVAAVTNTHVRDLDALSETVDPDALNRLCRTGDGGATEPVHVTFQYEGCEVTVRGDGRTVVRPASHDEA